MGTNTFFKYLNPKKLKQIFFEQFLGSKDSNLKLSVSVAIGILTGILPIWGFQTITAAFLALALRLNKIILLAASHISVFPLTPVEVFTSYIVGGIFYNDPDSPGLHYSSSFQYNITKEVMYQYITGSIVLAVTSAIIFGCLVYLVLFVTRKKYKQHIQPE